MVCCLFFSTVHADVVQKKACISAFDKNQAQVKNKLLTLAKSSAVEELFGSLVKSFTKVENFTLKRDDIETYSIGFIQVKGNPIYFQGKGFGEVCVTINADATEKAFEKIKPKQLSKKTCLMEGDLKTIKKRTEEKAKLEALFDYEHNLREYSPQKILPLLREVTFSEGGFVQGTPVYCVRTTGLLYPIEVTALAKAKKPNEQFVQGLKGEYFNLPPFEDSPTDFPEQPTFTRTDKLIDFAWENKAPAPKISADFLGVRWTGMIWIPITGSYFFRSHLDCCDDGIKLFIDNQSITIKRESCYGGICRWENNIYLEGDKWHPIQIEFFHKQEKAQMKLHWRMPGSSSSVIVPSEYFRTKNF